MTKIAISRCVMAAGSHGIYPRLDTHGCPIGNPHAVNIWTVTRDGITIGHYATRDEARRAARDAHYLMPDYNRRGERVFVRVPTG